jgi:hypothetical protein
VSDKHRCTNFITTTGLRFPRQCSRPADGADGYCTICRRAKKRGKVIADRNYEIRRARDEEKYARWEREASLMRAAKKFMRDGDKDALAKSVRRAMAASQPAPAQPEGSVKG